MEVDNKTEVNESEALLLGDGGDESEQTEFTSGDVELLLGDDDVHAFANESTDATSEASSVSKGTGPGGDLKPGGPNNSKTEQGQPIEGHYTRGGRGGRPFRGRGYGPPPPGYYPPRGLRPPFPGAVPRFGRHPPPFAFRGRGGPPMGYMRFPRGMYMRPPRPIRGQFHPHHELEEEEPEEEMNMSKSEEESSDSGAGGPKSLMSIKITKDVKATVQTQILDKAPKLMAPLGMGLGPRFHMRPGGRPPAPEGTPEVAGPRPRHPGPRGMTPSAPPPGGLLPTPAIRDRLGERPRGLPRGGGRGMGRDMDHSSRGSLKRSFSTPHHEGPRAKMMAPSYSHSSSYNGGRGDAPHHAATHGVGGAHGGAGSSAPPPRIHSNLRQIQTMDEPMQTAPPSHHHSMHQQQSYHSVPPPALSHHQQRGPHVHDPNHHQRYHVNNLVSDNAGRGGRGGFRVNHTPAPSLTQIQTVDNSRHQPRPSAAPPAAAAPRSAMPVGNVNNSNLRSIPTVGSGSNAPTPLMGNHKITKTGGMSSRVLISNLPPMMSFERISAMTTAAGNVRNINVNDNATAIVEFANPSSAENFIRTTNRKVIDRSMITVARLA